MKTISKIVLFSAILMLSFSCTRKVKICASFDSSSYFVGDTIYGDASCSEHAEDFLWTPQAGLAMIGNGTGPTERFIVEPLSGILSRSIDLTVSNSRSSRSKTESFLVP